MAIFLGHPSVPNVKFKMFAIYPVSILLAKVNSRSRSLYVVACPSVVYLSVIRPSVVCCRSSVFVCL